jgi:hypothetical protein
MVMTLLELVEGRNTTPMREAMLRLERGVRHLLTETGSTGAKPVIDAPEAPDVPPPPARPVLVQPQTIQGRLQPLRATPAEPRPQPATEREAADAGDALVELTSLGRGDPEDIVKEPPEISAPVAQIIRRLSDAAAASDA